MNAPRQLLLAGLALLAGVGTTFAQGTAFSYSGRLNGKNGPAQGLYDFQFSVYDAATNGTKLAGPQSPVAVGVTNGVFTVALEFGPNIFTGPPRWLDISVRTNNGAGGFTNLAPRQKLLAVPYAIYAGQSSNVINGAIAAGQLQTTNAAASGQVLTFNGTSLVWQTPGASNGAWGLTGNSGTTAGVNFIGTKDNQPLEFKVNGTRALRIESSGYPNLIGGSPVNFIAPGVGGAVIAGGGAPGTDITDYGYSNSVSMDFGAIGGGRGNTIQTGATDSMIGGGRHNTIQTGATASAIGGGHDNTILPGAQTSTIGGGGYNTIQTNVNTSTIDGGIYNTIQSGTSEAAISGGYLNTINSQANDSTIGGGDYNTIQTGADHSMIGGGHGNTIQPNATDSTISGGYLNTIQTNATYSTIGGGYQNTIQPNTIDSIYSTIGGGYKNTVSGRNATVPGGDDNVAAGTNSFAAGHRAKANHAGSFVWADTTGADLATTAEKQFLVRASGGINFFTSGELEVQDSASPVGTIHVGANTVGGDPKLVKFGDADYVHIGENGGDDWMELKAARFFFTHGDGFGYVGIGTNNPQALLHVAGEARVNILTITGGADVAEPFKMSSAAIPEGAVVIIDEENPGQLKMSERAYDQRVAGIVSGAHGIKPGISLSQQELNEGGQNVALSGRVYVLADAANGTIKPGDLLTTSSTPGHAMKVTNYSKAQGSIIGKAMSSLKAGKGMVLVLVTLQ